MDRTGTTIVFKVTFLDGSEMKAMMVNDPATDRPDVDARASLMGEIVRLARRRKSYGDLLPEGPSPLDRTPGATSAYDVTYEQILEELRAAPTKRAGRLSSPDRTMTLAELKAASDEDRAAADWFSAEGP